MDIAHITTTIFDIPYGIFVTPSEFYTNFEKLLLPFDGLTWILIVATSLIIVLVLLVTRFVPNTIESLFFGHGINTPGLNVIKIFFGIGQTRLPHKSITRFILVFFVLFCLIMRTCYQSKMFEFISTDMRKPLPKTLNEVIKDGYTIVFDINLVISDVFRIRSEIRNENEK
ncbi:hypothetical protein ACKWTF_015162 [Chironomus riparius]